MGTIFAIIALTLLVPCAESAQNPPAAGAQAQSPGAATSSAPDTTVIQLPPPVMRNVIATEKPIKGMPSGVIPRPMAETATGNPAAPQPAPAQVSNGAGTASVPAATGPTAAGTPASSS